MIAPIAKAQNSELDRQLAVLALNEYFNNLTTLRGKFHQYNHNGSLLTGDFYMVKPGKLLFRYTPPVKIDVVSDGSVLAIVNKKMQTQQLYPLKQTPFQFLAKENIDLTKEVQLSDVNIDNGIIEVSLEHQSVLGDTRIQLFFNQQDYTLKQWVTTDNQGKRTMVTIHDVLTGTKIPNHLFKIDRELNFNRLR